MEWYWAGAILLGCVMAGMAMGIPVAFTFLLTNIIGTCVFVIGRQDSIGDFFDFQLMSTPTYVSNAEIHTWGRDTEVGMAIDRRLGRRRGPTWTSWRRQKRHDGRQGKTR